MEQSKSRISDTFDASRWCEVGLEGLSDITYHRGVYPDGRPAPVVRIAFDRPQVRNAFRPETVDQLYRCLDHARCTASVAAILLTGNSPAADGGYAFCSGGDQKVRGNDGYRYETGLDPNNPATATLVATEQTEPRSGNPQPPTKSPTPAPAEDPRDVAGRLGRLHILEVQRLIRATPKPVIALVNGWATGGGHSLVMVCDLALASREHAQFKQVDANVGSFDAGYGSGLLARQAGDKKAREIFFLAQTYGAEDAERWGIVNRAVPHAQLEELGWEWALTIADKSPQAIRMLKYAFNALDDGLVGMQMFAGEATRLAYGTAEAVEGRNSFLQRRERDWSDFPYYY